LQTLPAWWLPDSDVYLLYQQRAPDQQAKAAKHQDPLRLPVDRQLPKHQREPWPPAAAPAFCRSSADARTWESPKNTARMLSD